MGHTRAYVTRVREGLYNSVTRDQTPRQVALSFAVGTVVTMLPAFGMGLLVFVLVARFIDWINNVALFASAVVFNPGQVGGLRGQFRAWIHPAGAR